MHDTICELYSGGMFDNSLMTLNFNFNIPIMYFVFTIYFLFIFK